MDAAVDPVDELLTPATVADELHTTTGTLDQLRYRGTGPKFIPCRDGCGR
jgi:hypothetical protein